MNVDRAELRRLLASLPYRAPKRVENGAAIDDVPSPDSADDGVLDHEREARLQAAKAALGRAVGRLAPEDALIVRLHFYEGFSIADVARDVGIPSEAALCADEAASRDVAQGPQIRRDRPGRL